MTMLRLGRSILAPFSSFNTQSGMSSLILKNGSTFSTTCLSRTGQQQQQKRYIPRKPSTSGRLFRWFIYIELVGIAGAYYVWRRMNRSQEFRFYMSQNYPMILDGFYTMGEKLGNLETRKYDFECWEKLRNQLETKKD